MAAVCAEEASGSSNGKAAYQKEYSAEEKQGQGDGLINRRWGDVL